VKKTSIPANTGIEFFEIPVLYRTRYYVFNTELETLGTTNPSQKKFQKKFQIILGLNTDIFNDFFIAEALIEKNCNLDVADTKGNTALHIACQRGHEIIASLILKATTPKSTYVSHQNKKGQT
jgi:hypothetical protein